VFLDGSPIGRTPVRLKQVTPGQHELRVSRGTTDVFVVSGKPLTLSYFKGNFVLVPEERPSAPEKPAPETKRTPPPEEPKTKDLDSWDRFINRTSPNF
jgi:hypothetical protein